MNNFDQQIAHLNDQLAEAYAGENRPMSKALKQPASAGAKTLISGEEFMMKALDSVSKGHITASQLTECEMMINSHRPPPAAIAKAVVNGVKYSPWG